MKTIRRLINPSKIRNAAKSDEEEYRRATFMTTQLYPHIRTSTVRDRIAAFCEDRDPDTGVLSIRCRITSKSTDEKC